MSIRTEAVAAFDAQRQARIDEARAHLVATVLHDPVAAKPAVDPKTLNVVHEDHDVRMFVFTDGDVDLAVYGDDEVVLVEQGDDGQWTRLSGALETLAGLGRVLAARGA